MTISLRSSSSGRPVKEAWPVDEPTPRELKMRVWNPRCGREFERVWMTLRIVLISNVARYMSRSHWSCILPPSQDQGWRRTTSRAGFDGFDGEGGVRIVSRECPWGMGISCEDMIPARRV